MTRDGVDGVAGETGVAGAAGETRGGQTKAAILRAARERFAAQGYERTTIRGVAADAGIDPSMVMRYFGSKERLFDAALEVDLRLPDLAGVAEGELARVLVRHFVERWEGDPADDALLVLLRSAVTNEAAAARMREVFAGQVAPGLAAALGAERGVRVAGLVSTHLLGLALTRYLLRLPPMTALSPEAVVASLTPALEATLRSTP
ncbi:TetR/AcrR family transcriptional regulator [Streptomyces sp. NBC_00347]|uniref:TetR/AcrR family transcriptional regulator n=1 Tax=Streptomyces sp. NBC_00347 TaxID=2975721 RepID=UPI002254451F|nr:TetR family transcriptional regulator [Streptomyces sp. NBC_00347]MCX5124859.1 TetR family transcriptional regulator [Streptomyces sp. NBC_00347]